MSDAEQEVGFKPPSPDTPTERIVYAVKESAALKFALLGVLQLVVAAFILEGVLAGMFGIFGAASVATGLLAYALLWVARRGA